MIFSKIRDPRFITLRRGGTLTDEDHHLLAVWAAICAQHVLYLFEEERPEENSPRRAIELTHAWVRGEIRMQEARNAAYDANASAKGVSDAAKFAALSAGQAACVAHVAAHELGAAAYAIRAVMASAPADMRNEVGRSECEWQRVQLPEKIRELVLDDQRLRNEVCWKVFYL